MARYVALILYAGLPEGHYSYTQLFALVVCSTFLTNTWLTCPVGASYVVAVKVDRGNQLQLFGMFLIITVTKSFSHEYPLKSMGR